MMWGVSTGKLAWSKVHKANRIKKTFKKTFVWKLLSSCDKDIIVSMRWLHQTALSSVHQRSNYNGHQRRVASVKSKLRVNIRNKHGIPVSSRRNTIARGTLRGCHLSGNDLHRISWLMRKWEFWWKSEIDREREKSKHNEGKAFLRLLPSHTRFWSFAEKVWWWKDKFD